MNKYTIDFFNKVSADMKMSEVFLGEVNVPWTYSIVSYTADCTEAMPLTLFDKAICGVLDLDGAIPAERLGEILGLNVVSDLDNGKYADNAEQELLSQAISSLVEFSMIERDAFNNLSLTPLGKEYFGKGKKFRTTTNKAFSAYYDVTGGNHAKAKDVFEYLTGMNVPSHPRAEYHDEAALKAFIHEQEPSIYDEETGNSFTNLTVCDIREVVCNVKMAVMYDFQEKKYRFVGFVADGDTQKEAAFFTEVANENNNLREMLISLFASSQRQASGEHDSSVEDFEHLACEAQGMYDFNKYNGEDPSEYAENFAAQRNVFEQERFWSNLSETIAEDTKEVFFNFGMLDMSVLAKLDLLSKERPDMSIFVLYRETDQTFEDHFGNVFFFKTGGNASGVFCCSESFKYEYVDYCAPVNGQDSIAIPMIHTDKETGVDTRKIKNNFAMIFAPRIYQEIMDYLDADFKGDKRDVKKIPVCDSNLATFREFISSDKLEALDAKKLRVFNEVKKAFETKQIEKLSKLEEEAGIDEIKKLDIVNLWKGRLNEILADADASYINLQEAAKAVKAKLAEREQYIREELMARTYVIDTNSLIQDPNIVNKFNKRDKIVIPLVVHEELDKKKGQLAGTPEGENARIARKNIDALQKKKRLSVMKGDLKLIPEELLAVHKKSQNPDNYIFAVAMAFLEKNPCVITNDNGLRTKISVEGIMSMSVDEFAERQETKANAEN